MLSDLYYSNCFDECFPNGLPTHVLWSYWSTLLHWNTRWMRDNNVSFISIRDCLLFTHTVFLIWSRLEHCNLMRGYFHGSANLCSQVNRPSLIFSSWVTGTPICEFWTYFQIFQLIWLNLYKYFSYINEDIHVLLNRFMVSAYNVSFHVCCWF